MRQWIEQVIAPLLIIQRVANKSALTSETITPGRVSEFKAVTLGESAGDGSALPAGEPMASVDRYGVGSGELRVETTTDFRQGEL